MTAVDAIRGLTVVLFGVIAVVSYRRWRRQGGTAARWVFTSFGLLTAATLLLALLPNASRAPAVEILRKLALAALALFPYSLYRFAAVLRAPRAWSARLATVLTALVVLATLAIPAVHLSPGEQRPGWVGVYIGALVLQWGVLSSFVAIGLWRAGRDQPTVARRRMRTLSVAAMGLTLALLLTGAASGAGLVSLGIRVIALISACLFLIGFTPPSWIRSAWRRPEQERLQGAVAELMGATTRDEVTARLLPHVAASVGASGAALTDAEGTVLGAHGEDVPAAGSRPAPETDDRISALGSHGPVHIKLPSGWLILATGPYTPFFGRDELELLRYLGALAELAIQRSEFYERERQARVALEGQMRFSQLLVDSSANGILAYDREYRYTVWNPGMERITGMERSRTLGRRAFDVFPFLTEIGEDRFFAEALAGRTVTSTDRPYTVPETGQEGFFESRYSPLYGETGEIIGGLSVVSDITDRKRAEEERQRLLREQAARTEAEARADVLQHLQRVTDTALAHLTLDDLFDEVLARIREILAVDTATILLAERETGSLVVEAGNAAQEGLEPGVSMRADERFAARVASKRRALILDPHEPPAAEAGAEPARMGAPILLGGRLLGVLDVARPADRPFSPEDVALLQLLADRAALAIEHADLYRREQRIAETLQRSLLPERLPDVPGLAIAARYLPAGTGAVGGDWYDVIPLADGRVGIAMGDVVGHGVAAAALMGQLRSGLRAYALDGDSPATVLERLDRLLCTFEGQGMVTLLYLVVDRDGEVRFASAGHPPPLMVGSDGPGSYLEEGRGPPLGVAPGVAYTEAAVSLEPRSVLIVYTDGLIERRRESIDAGLERLREAATAERCDMETFCEHILTALLPDGPGRDDAAVMAVRRTPVGAPLRLRLRAEPEAIAGMRRELWSWLQGLDLDARDARDVVLACAEACANVVEHACGPGEESYDVEAARVDGELTITVRDSGRWRAPRGGDHGRGLSLMRSLMDAVEIDRAPGGTTVVLRRRLTREAV